MGKRPVARKKLVWRVYQDYEPQQMDIATDGSASAYVRTLVTDAEVNVLDDECTLLRVVGDFAYWVYGPQALNLPIHIMWFMMVNESTVTAGEFTPFVAADVEELPLTVLQSDWIIGDGISSQGQRGVRDAGSPAMPGLDKLDIRVKRKLREGDELLMFFTARYTEYSTVTFPANTVASIFSMLNVRILLEA